MVKTIQFDPTGGDLYAEVVMTGVVIVSYSLRLFSADVQSEKVLQRELGNNLQPQDDTFRLCDKANPNEAVSNHHKRFVSLLANINTDKDDTPYILRLKIFQGNPADPTKLLDFVEYSGSISASDGGLTKSLGVILNKKNS